MKLLRVQAKAAPTKSCCCRENVNTNAQGIFGNHYHASKHVRPIRALKQGRTNSRGKCDAFVVSWSFTCI